MNRKMGSTIALGTFTLVVVFGIAWQTQAQGAKARYPHMATLDQYLMTDRNAEIALARSAAPEATSRDAEVLILGRHGYETAVKGKNGFVCLVERSWMSPFDSPEFWNRKIRSPACYNPPAARTIVPLLLKRTGLVLAGLSKARIIATTDAALFSKGVPLLQPGAMCYMMSKEAYLTDEGGHNMAHLMFYTPRIDGAEWGADLPGSPVMLGQQRVPGAPEPTTEFYVAVPIWSDGTAIHAH